MEEHDDETPEEEEEGTRPWARYALKGGAALVGVAVLLIGLVMLLRGDKNPPRKVQDMTIVAIVPPPPPPPPPPPQTQPPPETKMIEQTKQETIEEEKPVDIPKEAPPDADDEPMPGPPALDDAGKGPGELLGKQGGRGFIGGGGGGGGGGGSRWGWYASIVQSQIEAALRANEKTRNAVMQVQLRLWSDGTGRVNRVQLVSSSGNTELDSVIRDQVLSGMTLRQPPPKDMPMPINMRVTARRPG